MKKQLFFTCFFITINALLYAQPGQPFVPGCALPFQSIAVRRAIDDNCGIQGKGTTGNTAANQLQNAAKNNFCATGTVKNVTVTDLKKLHQKVIDNGIPFGNFQKVPADRSGLKALGEGTLVSFTGYINDVKYSNVDSGEGVNCKETDEKNNDIHIELAKKKNETNKCKRVSAEISPHFRPDDWNVDKLKAVKKAMLKIRITGQLFFDASHTACVDNPSGSRASSWEIHPAYRIEVFVNNQWKDLNEVNFPDEDE
jgi:hypothetical protein